jgi:protein TIF31
LHWSQEIAKEGKADTVEESAPALAGSSESCEEILFNPNVFTEFKLSGDPEVNI